jgi:hypothetical protein
VVVMRVRGADLFVRDNSGGDEPIRFLHGDRGPCQACVTVAYAAPCSSGNTSGEATPDGDVRSTEPSTTKAGNLAMYTEVDRSTNTATSSRLRGWTQPTLRLPTVCGWGQCGPRRTTPPRWMGTRVDCGR